MGGPSGVTYAYMNLSKKHLGMARSAPYLCHPTIDNKLVSVDEAALITGKEQHCLRLLDSLTKTTRREVDLAAVALSLIVTKPVLEKWSAGRSKSAIQSFGFARRTYLRGAGQSELKR